MIDKILNVIAVALLVLAGALVCILVAGLVYMAVDDTEYRCEKTGRQVLVMLPAGKVMVPIMQDETTCTKVEK